MSSERKQPAMLAQIPRTAARSAKASALPKSPEVDEEALAAAEREIGAGRSRGAGFPKGEDKPSEPRPDAAASPRRKGRVKREKEPTVNLYIRSPKPIADAFKKHLEDGNYKNAWAALEDLMLRSGIEIEDFDV